MAGHTANEGSWQDPIPARQVSKAPSGTAFPSRPCSTPASSAKDAVEPQLCASRLPEFPGCRAPRPEEGRGPIITRLYFFFILTSNFVLVAVVFREMSSYFILVILEFSTKLGPRVTGSRYCFE